MIDKVINAMIAAILGAVAFITIQALVGGDFYDGPISAHTFNASNGSYDFGTNETFNNLPYNSTNASPGDLMIHDILPLAIAIMVVVGLFMGLTHIRGI